MIDSLLTAANVWPLVKSLKIASGLSNKGLLNLYKDPAHRAQVEKILAKNGNLSNAERTDAAETLLGRKLSAEEKSCILSAHNIAANKVFNTSANAGSKVLDTSDLHAKRTAMSGCGKLTAVEKGLLMRAGITGNEGTPQAAVTHIRKAAVKTFGHDLDQNQVNAVWTAAGKSKDEAFEILKKAGFPDDEALSIAKGDLQKIKSAELQGVSLKEAQPTVAPTVSTAAASTAPAANQQSASEVLADLMDTTRSNSQQAEEVFAKVRTQATQEFTANKDALAKNPSRVLELSANGLETNQAVSILQSAIETPQDFAKTISVIDNKIASEARNFSVHSDYTQYRMQMTKVKLMEDYYFKKYPDRYKSGIDMDNFFDADEGGYEAYQAAQTHLAELASKKGKNWWPNLD